MYPIKALPNKTVFTKSMIEWTNMESKEFEWNNKGLYAIIKAITPNEYRRIQSNTKSKKA